MLLFSFVGYKSQEVPIAGRAGISLTLASDTEALGEVVVGYGTQRRQDVTGVISSVKAEDLRTQGSKTVQKSLQGRVAGAQIESAGGDPGSGVRILVRGPARSTTTRSTSWTACR